MKVTGGILLSCPVGQRYITLPLVYEEFHYLLFILIKVSSILFYPGGLFNVILYIRYDVSWKYKRIESSFSYDICCVVQDICLQKCRCFDMPTLQLTPIVYNQWKSITFRYKTAANTTCLLFSSRMLRDNVISHLISLIHVLAWIP